MLHVALTVVDLLAKTSRCMNSTRLFACILTLSLAGAAQAGPLTGVTGDYDWNADKMPISATTTFFNPPTNADLTNTVQHELGHALGFTTGYELFRNHLSADGEFRKYTSTGGTVLAKLEEEGSNHMRVGQTVDGNNQTNDIMRPDQVVNQRWGAQDTKILRDAFNWQNFQIDLKIVFQGIWTNAEKMTVTTAAAVNTAALGTNGQPLHTFTWTVISSVPEPSTFGMALMGCSVIMIVVRQSRRSAT